MILFDLSSRLPLAILFALGAAPAFGSIQGSYSGGFSTGQIGGAAFSYIHAATSAKKSGDAEYDQFAGGAIQYAIDNANDAISFVFNDPNGNGLDDGDSLTFTNATVGLLTHDGSFDSTNTGSAAGFLTLNGTLNVGGAYSTNTTTNFTHGIRNITAADTSAAHTGLFYTITDTSGSNVLYSGEIFFQSGALAGPFNGIKYDAGEQELTFALWGNSLNKGGRESGIGSGGGDIALPAPLGFDIFIQAGVVPEASSVVVWSLLGGIGLVRRRRRDSASR